MDITKLSTEFAVDFIELINSVKGFTYNGHVDYVTKNGKPIKFDYVSLDKIYNTIKQNNNFAIIEPLGTDGTGDSVVQVVVIHKSGEVLASDYYKLRVPENGTKQDEGSAITYTKRYALGSFLGLCTDEDNDANTNGNAMPLKKTNATGTKTSQELGVNTVVNFGKHSGKTIMEIGEVDPKYLDWLRDNTRKADIKEAIKIYDKTSKTQTTKTHKQEPTQAGIYDDLDNLFPEE